MKRKPVADFERLLRRFCRLHDLELATRESRGSHRSYYLKTGEGRKLASAVIKAGKKDMSAGTLRSIGKAFRDQHARQSDQDLRRLLQALVHDYTRWLSS